MRHTVESLLARCVEDGDCMVWQGGTTTDGAPVVCVRREDGRRQGMRVRRLMFQLLGQPIPRKRPYIIASCWHDRCVAPEHLRPANRREQMLGAVQAGRCDSLGRSAKQREVKRATQAKLSLDTARQIRHRYAEGDVTLVALAAEHGVHPSLIHRIVQHRAWQETAANSSVFNWRPTAA